MNDYLLAILGWLFFNAVMLGIAKDKDDEKKKRFNFKVWWSAQWDNLIITGLAIPIIVLFTADLWQLIVNDWLEKDWEYNSLALLGAVPLVQFIYFIVRKFAR